MTKKKTPSQVLKNLPRKVERGFVDAYDDTYPVYGDTDRVVPPATDEVLASATASIVLAVTMLHAMMPPKVLARIQAPASLALVVDVQGPDWIGPIALALTSFGAWTEVIKRSGKSNDKPSVGSYSIAASLGAGHSVVGNSTAPERYLPAALMTDQDQDVRLGQNVTALQSLGRLLDQADMEDMLGYWRRGRHWVGDRPRTPDGPAGRRQRRRLFGPPRSAPEWIAGVNLDVRGIGTFAHAPSTEHPPVGPGVRRE